MLVWWAIPDYRGDLNDFSGVVKIEDRDGRVLRVALGPSEVYCDPVPFSEMGEWTTRALIAFEDKRFLRHGGVDTIAVCRAAVKNLIRMRVTSGASTITTLVVKMTEPRERNLWTKLLEAHHAVDLEAALSKEAILGQFLNRAPFGGNVQGIEAASQRYFGKPARNLSLAESAMLMGLPQSPETLRPDRYLEQAIRRRNWVLWRMLENKFISEEQHHAAREQTMCVRREALPFLAPHFCDFLLRQNPERTVLASTLDVELQRFAEEALRARIAELSKTGVHGGAVVVADIKTGDILAMVGSPDFWKSQVNGAVARRSPGSTLKPFAFAEVLERGAATPSTVFADVPTRFANYSPENYSLEYNGPVSMRRALVQSLNIPALRCAKQIGVTDFVDRLRELGFSTLDRSANHYGLGIVVGSCETTLLDLVTAYACLARGGTWLPARFLCNEPVDEPRRIFSPETTFMMADILGGEERSEELVGHRADVFLPRIAWKTGTSSGYRDAWTIAYNPNYVVGVWLGNPDGTASSRLIGGSAAAPVAGEIFRRLYPTGESPWFEKPAGLKTRSVCAHSGQLPGKHCRAIASDYYVSRVSPISRCDVHRENETVWPRDIQDFLEMRGMSETVVAEKKLQVTSPVPGETFRLLPASPGVRQAIALTAVSSGDVYWFIDGKQYNSDRWLLEKGRHTIACADVLGDSVQFQIFVE